MGTPTVDQAKVVLNEFSSLLQNNLIAADIADWDLEPGEMDDRNRLQVSEQIPPRFNVTETTDGVKDLSSGTDDPVFGSEMLVINKTFNANMGMGDFEAIRDFDTARQSKALKSAALNMAEKIDAHVLNVAAKASSNWVGTPGLDIDNQDEVASAYTRLKEEGVSDADIWAVLNYTDKQGLGDQVVNLDAPGEEAARALRKGFKGMVAGVQTRFTQQLPVLTMGSRAASGAAAVNGASQNSNYSDTCIASAAGQFNVQTLAIDGLTGSQTIKAGEVFTIAGVYAYDPRAGVALSHLQQFTVVEDATASTGAIAALKIFPAIIVPGSGSGGDINTNTANATVDAAPANDAPITFLGAVSTTYRPRFMIQKGAVCVKTKKLRMPKTGSANFRQLTKVPISVRMWENSDFGTGAHGIRFDVALTANIAPDGRRRICRFNGVA